MLSCQKPGLIHDPRFPTSCSTKTFYHKSINSCDFHKKTLLLKTHYHLKYMEKENPILKMNFTKLLTSCFIWKSSWRHLHWAYPWSCALTTKHWPSVFLLRSLSFSLSRISSQWPENCFLRPPLELQCLFFTFTVSRNLTYFRGASKSNY